MTQLQIVNAGVGGFMGFLLAYGILFLWNFFYLKGWGFLAYALSLLLWFCASWFLLELGGYKLIFISTIAVSFVMGQGFIILYWTSYRREDRRDATPG